MYDHIMSELVNPIFYQLIVKADSFYASEICIGCGQCVKMSIEQRSVTEWEARVG